MATAAAVPLPGVPEAVPAPEEKSKKPKKPKKPKKVRLLLVAIGMVLATALAYTTFAPSDSHAEEAPTPGAVLKLESITLNLAEGHFLKLGLALQFTAEAEAGHGGGELDGSQALDLAIAQLSNRKLTDLNSSTARAKAKEQLVKAIQKAYHGAVMDVYFTEFVMQ